MVTGGDERLIGACGINCAMCDIYRAYSEGNVKKQKKVIESIFGKNSDVKPEQITCDGCGGRRDLHWSPECEIRQCAHGKGLIACSQCPEFPCPRLEEFYSRGYEKAKANALRQREIGVETWWKEQQHK